MKKNSDQLLSDLIDLLIYYLTELSDVFDEPTTQFVYGEKTAYVECLEFIANWDRAEENGLNFEVEERFPLI